LNVVLAQAPACMLSCAAEYLFVWYSDVLQLIHDACCVVSPMVLDQPGFLGTAAWLTLKNMLHFAGPPFGAVLLVVLGTLYKLGTSIYDAGHDVSSSFDALEQSIQSDSGKLRWPGMLPVCALLLAAPLAAVFWLLKVVVWSVGAAAFCVCLLVKDAGSLALDGMVSAWLLYG
jgi:hypothetical protein